jgi:hypothetical protein
MLEMVAVRQQASKQLHRIPATLREEGTRPCRELVVGVSPGQNGPLAPLDDSKVIGEDRKYLLPQALEGRRVEGCGEVGLRAGLG